MSTNRKPCRFCYKLCILPLSGQLLINSRIILAKFKYFVAPADPERSESTTDASLSWVGDEWFDFEFRPEKDIRLLITCDLIRTGETDIDPLGPGADMLMVLSLRWTSELERSDLVDGLEDLEKMREDYRKLREGEGEGLFPEVRSFKKE